MREAIGLAASSCVPSRLNAGQLVDKPRIAAIETSYAEVFEQPRNTQIEHGMVQPGNLSGTRVLLIAKRGGFELVLPDGEALAGRLHLDIDLRRSKLALISR